MVPPRRRSIPSNSEHPVRDCGSNYLVKKKKAAAMYRTARRQLLGPYPSKGGVPVFAATFSKGDTWSPEVPLPRASSRPLACDK